MDELEDDEDDIADQGASIVIGRTLFLLGEMRLYVGMPAYNPMDGKDRILGQGISAVARRRGSKHRSGERWNRGDYGRKDMDTKA